MPTNRQVLIAIAYKAMRFPSLREIAKQFNVSHETVRSAVKSVEAENEKA